MTADEMVSLIKQRTKISDDSKVLRELQSAYRWASRRIFNAANGPDLLLTLGEELTAFVSVTRTLDLEAAVAGGFLALKRLWALLPGDTRFVQLIPVDSNDSLFTRPDAAPAATPDIAAGHPVYYDTINFSSVRFAPALPATTVLRVDYFRSGSPPDPSSNNTTENGTDLPAVFHDAICTKATAQLFNTLDDSREAAEETRARDELNDAIYQATTRVQAPTTTQPFRSRRRRFI